MPNSKKKTIEELTQLNEIRKEQIKSLTEIMEMKDQKFENLEKLYQGQETRLKNVDELMKNKDDMLDLNEKIINRYELETEAQEKKIAELEEIINKYGPPNDTSMVTIMLSHMKLAQKVAEQTKLLETLSNDKIVLASDFADI
ncbi:unnamed protein product [Caenorhabditis nigoni]|uniref:Uncharacterized protein n=1 Tax=Caenorhabditis nigoni TaxID=1611254 RepID=A0A2G5SPZ0_9PELO|nr:hypothetical protein B9Z55_023393 [Caenorhabditis nigoni]